MLDSYCYICQNSNPNFNWNDWGLLRKHTGLKPEKKQYLWTSLDNTQAKDLTNELFYLPQDTSSLFSINNLRERERREWRFSEIEVKSGSKQWIRLTNLGDVLENVNQLLSSKNAN